MAIQAVVPMPQWMASFLAMTGPGRNGAVAAATFCSRTACLAARADLAEIEYGVDHGFSVFGQQQDVAVDLHKAVALRRGP